MAGKKTKLDEAGHAKIVRALLRKRMKELAKVRDSLREDLNDNEELLDNAEEAYRLLEDAVEIISRRV